MPDDTPKSKVLLNLPTSYGWVGLGSMGYPMAIHLRRKLPRESVVTVYDLNQEAIHRYLSATAEYGPVAVASDSKEVAEKSECIITIVPEGSHVKDVYLTPDTGLLATDISGKLFLECSTIDIATSLEIGKAVHGAITGPASAYFYDAPVSGGTYGAERATLTLMVGCAPSDPNLPLIQEILSAVGTHVNALGGPGLGLGAKLSNNYLSSVIALATSEAMNLGMRLGIDPKVLSNTFATSSGSSWCNTTVNPVPGVCPDAVTSRGYEPGFKIQLMKKDILLAMDAAKQVDARLVLGDANLAAYAAASEDPRCRDRDNRVIYRWIGGYEPPVPPRQ